MSLTAVLDGMKRSEAARLGGMDRQTLCDGVLALPFVDTQAMQFHLDEISRTVRRAQAVVPLDRAGWHITGGLGVPKNVSLVFLPPQAPN